MGSSLPVFTKILKAVEDGEVRFELLSLKEVQCLDDDCEVKIATGELEGPAERKIRSDAGKRKIKRKRRDDTSEDLSDEGDEDDGRTTKRGRKSSDRSHASAALKSKEILTDTDESE